MIMKDLERRAYVYVKVETLLTDLKSSLQEIVDFNDALKNGSKLVSSLNKNPTYISKLDDLCVLLDAVNFENESLNNKNIVIERETFSYLYKLANEIKNWEKNEK